MPENGCICSRDGVGKQMRFQARALCLDLLGNTAHTIHDTFEQLGRRTYVLVFPFPEISPTVSGNKENCLRHLSMRGARAACWYGSSWGLEYCAYYVVYTDLVSGADGTVQSSVNILRLCYRREPHATPFYHLRSNLSSIANH